MIDLFLQIVNRSISAGYLVLAVLLLRPFLKYVPKRFPMFLWGMVGIRMLIPFSFKSVLSLLPSAQTISPDIATDPQPSIHTGISMLNSTVNPVLEEMFAPIPENHAFPLQNLLMILSILWLIVAVVLLFHAAFSYGRLCRRMRTAVPLWMNIYLSDRTETPFVLGILRPRIYLPFHLSESERGPVIAHERAHIDRRDHLWKPLGFLLLALHWFNPLMWAAYTLFCRDIELACDERVIKGLDKDHRAEYSQALLSCSTPRHRFTTCPLAFGETDVKKRVRSVLNYKKPAVRIIIIAVVICSLLIICFMTDPPGSTPANLHMHSFAVEEIPYQSGIYSFVMIPGENTPWYSVTTEFDLLEKTTPDSNEGWVNLGRMQEIELTRQNFDGYFGEGSIHWNSRTSAAAIRRGNEKAWRLIYERVIDGTQDPILYYLLQQKNGDVYLAYGYYDPEGERDPYSDDSSIRWLFKLSTDFHEDTGCIALSGEQVIPIVGLPVGTPLTDIREELEDRPWLEISMGEDDLFVPFRLYCDGHELYGNYSIYDAETLEPLEFFRPSGLSPQTYLFQNAKPGGSYIVTLWQFEGNPLWCFGARLP